VELALGGFGLVGVDEGLGFVELGGGDLGVVYVAGEDRVVVLDGEGGLVGAHLHLAEIEVGVAGEVVVGVGLDEVGELGGGEGVAGGDVIRVGAAVHITG